MEFKKEILFIYVDGEKVCLFVVVVFVLILLFFSYVFLNYIRKVLIIRVGNMSFMNEIF